LSSIRNLLTVLHNRHIGGCERDFAFRANTALSQSRIRLIQQKLQKIGKKREIRGGNSIALLLEAIAQLTIEFSFIFSISRG
jgi:hypothetical protein